MTSPKTKAKKFAQRFRGPVNRRMRWDTWVRDFRPVEDKDGPRKFETFGVEIQQVLAAYERNPRVVWTMIDGGGRNPTIASGYHLVNRIVYYITEIPADENTFYEVSL